MEASVCVGQSLPQTLIFIGVTLDVMPKIASHQIQLATSALYTGLNEGDTMSPVRTNLSATCRVFVPNAGGVLMASPGSKDINGTNYWLILSPAAVDGFGKPINL
jgi:hypothetical protein